MIDPSLQGWSRAIALAVLLGLGVLVFHRSSPLKPHAPNAPQSPVLAARRPPANERFFLAKGVAAADRRWRDDSEGADLPQASALASGSASKAAARVLSIDFHCTELGVLRGILEDARAPSDGRVAALALHDSSGDMIKLVLKLKQGPAPGGFSGTYKIIDGTGKFDAARGEGSYRDAPMVSQQWEVVSVTLEGAIRY